MQFKIDPTHPVFTSTPFIQDKTCNTLEELKINYFQYVRCYRDGSFTLLTNSTKVLEELIQLKSPTLSYYQAPFCDSLSYNFLWEETLPEVPVTAVKEKHNFHNGLTILNRHHQYYDMIAFAMPGDLANKNTLYLNYLGYLKSFAEDFVVDHRQLFKHLDTHRLVPPDALKDPNREILCLPTTQEYSLSPQESLCLRLLKKGYTYKRIGLKLGLSPRTVETYLTRIKEKTGATSKDHLLTLPLL